MLRCESVQQTVRTFSVPFGSSLPQYHWYRWSQGGKGKRSFDYYPVRIADSQHEQCQEYQELQRTKVKNHVIVQYLGHEYSYKDHYDAVSRGLLFPPNYLPPKQRMSDAPITEEHRWSLGLMNRFLYLIRREFKTDTLEHLRVEQLYLEGLLNPPTAVSEPGAQPAGISQISDSQVEPSNKTDGAPGVAVAVGSNDDNDGETVETGPETPEAEPDGNSPETSDRRVAPEQNYKSDDYSGTLVVAVGSSAPVPSFGSSTRSVKETDTNNVNGGETVENHESDAQTFPTDSGSSDSKPLSQATLESALQTSAVTGNTQTGNGKRVRKDGAPFRKTRSRTQKRAPPLETSDSQAEQSSEAHYQTGPPAVAVESSAAVSRGSTTLPPKSGEEDKSNANGGETVETETEKPGSQPATTSPETSDSRVEPDQSNKADDQAGAPVAAVGSVAPVPACGSTALHPKSGELDMNSPNGGETVEPETEKSGAQPVGGSREPSYTRVEPDQSNKNDGHVGTPGAAVGSSVPVPACGSTALPPKSVEVDTNNGDGGETVENQESDVRTFPVDSGASNAKHPSPATAVRTSAVTGNAKRGNSKRARKDGAPVRETRSLLQKRARRGSSTRT
jgi:hypothetical protein